MRTGIILALALLCCGEVCAKPRHWYSSKQFWVGEAVIVGATIADARTTCDGFRRGLVEGNPLGRGTQSCGASIGILGIGTAVYTGLHIASYRMIASDDTLTWQTLSLITVPAVACAFHCSAAIHNAKLNPVR